MNSLEDLVVHLNCITKWTHIWPDGWGFIWFHKTVSLSFIFFFQYQRVWISSLHIKYVKKIELCRNSNCFKTKINSLLWQYHQKRINLTIPSTLSFNSKISTSKLNCKVCYAKLYCKKSKKTQCCHSFGSIHVFNERLIKECENKRIIKSHTLYILTTRLMIINADNTLLTYVRFSKTHPEKSSSAQLNRRNW